VDDEAVTRLRQVIGKLARRLNVSATEEGLTPSQASVLGLVAGRGTLSLADLAKLEGLNPTMVSRVVGRLDELGLIQRTPDPADLRAASAEITPLGKQVDARVKAQRAAVVSACIARMPAAQVNALVGALPALEALADELRQLS
jgi:DNA-binding MarR family transcriptional regulator